MTFEQFDTYGTGRSGHTDRSWVGRDDCTDRARAVIERGGHATKVNFMWDVVTQREVHACKVNIMWGK